MINRYTRPEMGKIWTDENRYAAWLEVEILASEAWSELGYIPKEDVQKMLFFLSKESNKTVKDDNNKHR